MATLISSKYSLKSLHEEISLLDRKLAHLHKYEVFSSESEREAAAAKIEHKRDLLVRQARVMVEEGIEFQNSDLPHSLRNTADAEPAPEAPTVSSPDVPAPASARKAASPESQFSGTVLDSTQALQQYREKKGKRNLTASQPVHSDAASAAS